MIEIDKILGNFFSGLPWIKIVLIGLGLFLLILLLFFHRELARMIIKIRRSLDNLVYQKKDLSRMSQEDILQDDLNRYHARFSEEKSRESEEKINQIKQHEKAVIRETIKRA